jgi:hypothetical protein
MGPLWAEAAMHLHPRAPSLETSHRRPRGGVPVTLVAVLAMAAAGYWLWRVVGRDLSAGAHLNASHEQDKPSVAHPSQPAVATAPGGPAMASTPARAHVLRARPTQDPVAAALLAGGKDQLARKVAAVWGKVDDVHAAKGSPFDLVERGLSDLLPLRTAVARHRLREPKAYGLAGRPHASKPLTAEHLLVFLQTFARPVAAAEALEPGDIAYLQRRGGHAWPAIVSDTLDAEGQPLVITLDPADRVAKEQSLAKFALLHAFRLSANELQRVRESLSLSELQAASARVL